MKESDIRLRLHHALQWRGYWPLHHQDARPCPRCGNIIVPEVKGRPDTEARHTKFPIVMIEVKALGVNDLAFPFAEISEDQRKYLTAWEKEGGQSYLCIGKIVPQGTRTAIDSIYVIVWQEWLNWEQSIETLTGRKSIPYDYSLYTKPGNRDMTDLVNRARSWSALEGSGKDWHFKDAHPIAVQPEVEVPFYRRVKGEKA